MEISNRRDVYNQRNMNDKKDAFLDVKQITNLKRKKICSIYSSFLFLFLFLFFPCFYRDGLITNDGQKQVEIYRSNRCLHFADMYKILVLSFRLLANAAFSHPESLHPYRDNVGQLFPKYDVILTRDLSAERLVLKKARTRSRCSHDVEKNKAGYMANK